MGLLAQSVDVPLGIAIVVGVLGLIGTVAAAVAVARQYAIKASLATIIEANAELRLTNIDLKARLDEEAQKRAHLSGQMDILTSHFAEQIVEAVVRTVERTSAMRSQQVVTTTQFETPK